MNTAQVIQVIKTDLLRRGEGKSADDPVRMIIQYWTMDGKLLWEDDPLRISCDKCKYFFESHTKNG